MEFWEINKYKYKYKYVLGYLKVRRINLKMLL